MLPTESRPPVLSLTPEQRFAFDVKGYAVLKGALSAAEIEVINLRLDAIEDMGLRYRDGAVPGGKYRQRFGNFPDTEGLDPTEAREAIRAPDDLFLRPQVLVEDGAGGTAGIRFANSGQKMWAMNALKYDKSLAPMLAANPVVQPYVDEMVREPKLGLFAPRFQWQGAESEIHGPRDDITTPVAKGTKECGNYFVTDDGRLQCSNFRLMYLLSDVEPRADGPSHGGLMVIPGSHKRDVVWNPRGAWQNQSGNTRWADMDDEARSLFVELTGKAGTAIIFTHDIIHQSYHEADSYRRVVHLTYDHGDRRTSLAPSEQDMLYAEIGSEAPAGSWLRYVMRGASKGAKL